MACWPELSPHCRLDIAHEWHESPFRHPASLPYNLWPRRHPGGKRGLMWVEAMVESDPPDVMHVSDAVLVLVAHSRDVAAEIASYWAGPANPSSAQSIDLLRVRVYAAHRFFPSSSHASFSRMVAVLMCPCTLSPHVTDCDALVLILLDTACLLAPTCRTSRRLCMMTII